MLEGTRGIYHRPEGTVDLQNDRGPILAIPHMSSSGYLVRALKAKGIFSVHTERHNLKRKLVSTRPTHNNEVGTYIVPCLACPKCYVGQTGRGFTQRISEHTRAMQGDTTNAIYNHFADTGHRPNFEAAKIVYHSNNLHNRWVVDSSLIEETINFNQTPGVYSLDRLTNRHILKHKGIQNNLQHLGINLRD